MKRIAGELGVSITTVSKVLNNRDDIGQATRARVLAKVAELGYQPNAVARSLTLRRTHTLGIVIPDLMHSFFVEIVAGLERWRSARGYGLLLCSSNEDPEGAAGDRACCGSARWTASSSRSANASGNTDLLQRLGPRGIGLVMIDRDDHPDVRCDRVVTDDERSDGWRPTHLIGQGRRAIAHIAGTADRPRQAARGGIPRRAEGARASSCAPNGSCAAGSWRPTAIAAMKKLLAVRPRLDAVFAANDPSAIGAMKAIWDAGLRVPDDIAVVGAGDIALGDLLRVPLTTVSWSREDQGRTGRASCC